MKRVVKYLACGLTARLRSLKYADFSFTRSTFTEHLKLIEVVFMADGLIHTNRVCGCKMPTISPRATVLFRLYDDIIIALLHRFGFGIQGLIFLK